MDSTSFGVIAILLSVSVIGATFIYFEYLPNQEIDDGYYSGIDSEPRITNFYMSLNLTGIDQYQRVKIIDDRNKCYENDGIFDFVNQLSDDDELTVYKQNCVNSPSEEFFDETNSSMRISDNENKSLKDTLEKYDSKWSDEICDDGEELISYINDTKQCAKVEWKSSLDGDTTIQDCLGDPNCNLEFTYDYKSQEQITQEKLDRIIQLLEAIENPEYKVIYYKNVTGNEK